MCVFQQKAILDQEQVHKKVRQKSHVLIAILKVTEMALYNVQYVEYKHVGAAGSLPLLHEVEVNHKPPDKAIVCPEVCCINNLSTRQQEIPV